MLCADAGNPPCSPDTISINPLAIPPTFIHRRERRVRAELELAEVMGGFSHPSFLLLRLA